jgi:ABC-type transport system involved in cytochrome c biogenesis ATPase subunit
MTADPPGEPPDDPSADPPRRPAAGRAGAARRRPDAAPALSAAMAAARAERLRPLAVPPDPRVPGAVALSLDGVAKRAGRRLVLAGATAEFRIGELTLIRGARGSGKTVLARLLCGQTLPDEGGVRRLGLAAPLVGAAWGFAPEVPAIEGLELRASAHGLDLASYADAVAAAMGGREPLGRRFGRLNGRERQLLCHASAWLTPARLYVADGALLPLEREALARLEPLCAAARARAAVVWIADEKTDGARFAPDRRLRLTGGRLVPET